MNPSQRILIAEHEIHAARALSTFLKNQALVPVVVFDERSALKELAANVDFFLLDCDLLQDSTPSEFCRTVRELSNIPLLLFAENCSRREKIRALAAGADDFLSKPLDLEELNVRMEAIWRRYALQPALPASQQYSEKSVSYPQLCINLSNYTVSCGERVVEMPPKELELLYFLAASPNQVFTREQLLDQVWGYDYVGEARTVDVHIKRIRAKIKDHAAWSLDTVWGVGYKFNYRPNHILSDDLSAPSAQNDSV